MFVVDSYNKLYDIVLIRRRYSLGTRTLTLHSRGDRPFSWGIVILGILGSLSIRAVLSPIARACVFWSRNTDYIHTCGN